jgi:excisionase family DNA binding protein
MEELKMAICALKQAEEALAKRGLILRFKVRVKPDRGFFHGMIKRMIEDIAAPAPKTTAAALPPEPMPVNERTLKIFPGGTAEIEHEQPEAVPEQEHAAGEPKTAAQNPEEGADEAEPVEALNIKNAASYLGISVPGVYDLLKRGRITAHGKLGSRWFLAEELDQYLREREKRHA